MRPRVVILAYYYPPLVGIASERAAAFSVHLHDLGWDVVVITARCGFYHQTLVAHEPPVPVIRTRSFELSRVFRKVYAIGRQTPEGDGPTTVRPVDAGRVAKAARGVIRDLVYVPDAQVGWIPFATRAASRVLGSDGTRSVVFSTSVPYSAHFAAMRVARRSGAPWVAEFRDPWSTGRSPNRTRRRLRRRLDRHLERWILRTADHVILTSESVRLEVLAANRDLQPDRVSVVTNGFEPMREGKPPAETQPMTILYAGTVAPGEDMAPLLATLDRVHVRHPGGFRLRVLGPAEPWQPAGTSASDRPWLELDGIVSSERAREAMTESSVLLLVQQHPAYRAVLPGKLFEYIGARRPILAVVPGDTGMAALIRRYADARLVSPHAMAEFATAVSRLLGEHRAGDLQHSRVPLSVTAPLQRSEQAKRLAQIFAEVAGSEI